MTTITLWILLILTQNHTWYVAGPYQSGKAGCMEAQVDMIYMRVLQREYGPIRSTVCEKVTTIVAK